MAYRWAGWDFGVRRAILSGSPIEKKVFSSFRGKLKAIAFREIFLDTFEMDERRRREYIERLQKFRPRILYGYVSSCAALAKQIIQDDRYLSIPSIVTSAEMLLPAHRDIIESAFHGRVFNLYGSREITAIAMECSAHIGMHCPIDRIVLEVLQDNKPAAPGESGEIVLTDLQNYGMPFIRYKIGDMGRILEKKCPCGREMPLIELTEGRICDMIITPEGKYLPGEFFPHLFKEVSRQVEQFQILQERVDELIVKIVPAPGYGQEQTDYLLGKIKEKTGSRMAIAFRFVKEIPPEQSGKQRVTISKLPRARAFGHDPLSPQSPQ
jgi:phenylacetate-CoA ligase